MLSGLFFALGIIIAVLYLPRTQTDLNWPRSLHKTLPVALFSLAAFAANAPYLLTAALALSAIGDFALSRPNSKAFLIGMVAFALAHIGYIALMVPMAQFSLFLVLPALVLIGFGVSTEGWLAPHTGDLRGPVRAYVAVIMAMGLAALGLFSTHLLALIGAIFFVISDFVLAIETFVMAKAHRNRLIAGKTVWITYIAAQACLLLGLGV